MKATNNHGKNQSLQIHNTFMADFGDIKTDVKHNIFKQNCCSYYKLYSYQLICPLEIHYLFVMQTILSK